MRVIPPAGVVFTGGGANLRGLEELARDIHALSIQAMTREEWDNKGGKVMPSPRCLGGSAADK